MYDNSLSCKHVATQKLILTLLSQDFSGFFCNYIASHTVSAKTQI